MTFFRICFILYFFKLPVGHVFLYGFNVCSTNWHISFVQFTWRSGIG